MLFTDFKFFLVMPIIFLIYWALPVRFVWLRKVFLLGVSYLLYVNFNPAYAVLLLAISLVTFFGAKMFERGVIRRKGGVLVAVLAALPLVTFKYYNFINDSLSSLGCVNSPDRRTAIKGCFL